MSQKEKPTAGIRLVSMFVDHFIMTLVIAICGLMISLPLLLKGERNTVYNITFAESSFLIAAIFGCFSLYFNKDILNGRSPAKRILKLQVVDRDTEIAASPMKCLKRNLTIIIWPLEVLITIFNPTQRLGDRLANTKVVCLESTKKEAQIDKISVLKALFVGLVYSLLIYCFFILVWN